MQEPSSESPSTARTKSIGTKVTEEEYAKLERLAQNRRMSVSEWSRQTLLGQLTPEPALAVEELLLREILGTRMIVLNAIYALANEQRLNDPQMQNLIEAVDREKATAARDLLARCRNRAGGG